MAKATIMFPTSFELKISKLGKDIDAICGEAVQAGAEVVLPVVKANLSAVIGDTEYPSRSTGELYNSLGVSKPKVDRNGIINVKIGFSEPRRNQYVARGKRSYKTITNAMIANVIEHGKHGQPAKPFLARAKRQSKEACANAIKEKLEKEIEMI